MSFAFLTRAWCWLTKPKSEVDFRALLEGSLDMICLLEVASRKPRYVYASPSTLDVLGWTPAELMQLPREAIFTQESLSIISADIDQLRAGRPTSMVMIEAIRKDGAHVWLENKVRVLSHKKNGEIRIIVCMRDVTRRKLLEERLAQLALVDGLTGIGNRRAFDQGIDREWKRTPRTGLPLSLVLLDVDHFKLFNDLYGHQAGDECLRAIAGAVSGEVKRVGDIVARYGGEEFAILLPDAELSGAEAMANRFCAAVAALQITHEGNPEACDIVTVSCGVSTAVARLGGKTQTPEELLLAADSALYRAKRQGRNRVVTALLPVTTGITR